MHFIYPSVVWIRVTVRGKGGKPVVKMQYKPMKAAASSLLVAFGEKLLICL